MFLEQINSPADVKKLSVGQLKTLADELRQYILNSVSKTGGHLASNLGVVELTLALHYVFDFAKDKLLWDVGHQCYAHKIITGRRESFKKLRQADGISGFPNPKESPYDQFGVGHAGTSIASAIGMAIGMKKNTQNDKIVVLIGDASIVNGTSFEALNNLGLVNRQLLIVLNDNSMAIDDTVGAVAKYFAKIRLSHTYEDLRKTTSNILAHMPIIGKSVEEAIERIKKSIRMALPASQLFESLNVPYFGPVDGYDIESLIELFRALDQLNHPAILHVYTRKGKGFRPAGSEPSRFHSTGPFKINGDMEEGGLVSKKRSFTDVFGERLVELAKKDDSIVAITSAMCDGTGLTQFRKNFPDRFYDVGIAEAAAVDIAAGLAKSGLKPVVCIYSTFLQRSFDQILQEVALQNLPVVFCIDRAGVVGQDGPTHHGLMDIGFLRMMPNVVLAAPADEFDLKNALDFALSQNRCVCLRYPKDIAEQIAACNKPFKLGKSIVVKRSKSAALAIVSYGAVLTEVLAAARVLQKEGVNVEVINARFAAPIDQKIITMFSERKGIITVEEHQIACGFGSAILEEVVRHRSAFQNTRTIEMLGAPRRFIKHNSRKSQLMDVRVNADIIVKAAKKMLKVAR